MRFDAARDTMGDLPAASVTTTGFPAPLDPVDDLPPTTVITHLAPIAPGKVEVRGTTTDGGKVVRVVVNGSDAVATRPNFAEWRTTIPSQAGTSVITAAAADEAGNVELVPHRLKIRTP